MNRDAQGRFMDADLMHDRWRLERAMRAVFVIVISLVAPMALLLLLEVIL